MIQTDGNTVQSPLQHGDDDILDLASCWSPRDQTPSAGPLGSGLGNDDSDVVAN